MRLVLASAALAAALPVEAGCQWEWLCNGHGVCRQTPICDSVYDLPPPRPDVAPPSPPPIALRPDRPTGRMSGLTCEPVMREAGNGQWTWTEVCYCSVPSAATRQARPLADITRCEPPWPEPERALEPDTTPRGGAPA